jgi:hypothetical protein
VADESNTELHRPALAVTVLIPDERLPRPEAVNFFAISRVGAEIQVVSAYVDANQAATLQQRWAKGEETPLVLEALPLHRIVVSVSTFEQLRKRVDEIHEALTKDGRLEPRTSDSE